ncbi:hypothetical protein A2707_02875 [Candidatus Saccharibacteria bacterium RIFCSPHIGHO2_01_FULL_45_15]|nr:MAG: hypothetical protein A2707_02875 [Candidatus Saccharibacteria bacterium RIFCSPHIGHO2_01_FULL_45_15]OGL27057.1 MAG: hypothetical protein A3C39_00725 [Candidatus Saccharibacteria bacterium RIFCSPHIGHO2_02_FULL_46_12]OGL31868.1 MAG: hypothetical protein A3E76_03470 [Candidatus Saccharibacteria bacterium RIFCSPHIGHO2_12_FULL_44_22]
MLKKNNAPPKPLSVKRLFIWILLFLVVTILALIIIERKKEIDELRTLPVPGRLVTINGNQKVHINCTGEGKQTVILESGMGGTSLDWVRVQPELAKKTKVCSYDRPGYGWSDEAKSERNASVSADDLYAILQASDARPPYVIVGGSYGGLISRLFTQRHIKQVDALIQIDPSHESDLKLPNDSPEQLSKTDFSTSTYLALDVISSYLGIIRANSMNSYSKDDFRTKEQLAMLSSPKNFRTMLREYNSLTKSTTLVRDNASSFNSLKVDYLLTSNRYIRKADFCHISIKCTVKSSGNEDHLIPQNNPSLIYSVVTEALQSN